MTLADNYNLRAEQASMSDVSAMVDTFETVTSYTPTYTYNGTSVSLTTLFLARYLKLAGGKLTFVEVNARVNLVGIGPWLTVSLPFTNGQVGYTLLSSTIAVGGSTAFEVVSGIISGTTNLITLHRAAGANYSAGSWDIFFSGYFYTA
jgi:hypothetical protein